MCPNVSLIRWIYRCAKHLTFAQQFFPMLMFSQPRRRLVTAYLNSLPRTGTSIKRECTCRTSGKLFIDPIGLAARLAHMEFPIMNGKLLLIHSGHAR